MRHLTLLFLIPFAISSAAAGAVVEYLPARGVLPTQICPSFDAIDTSTTTDPVVSDGKLVLHTTHAAHDMGYIQNGPFIDFSQIRTIEARLRLVSGTSSAANRAPAGILFTTAPNVGGVFFIDRDRVFLLTAPDNVGPVAFVDTDDAFHTYRLEIEPAGTIRLFYDDALLLTGSTFTSSNIHGGVRRIRFGELTAYARGRSDWEFFRHDAAAAGVTHCLASWWPAEGNALDTAGRNHGTLTGHTQFGGGVCGGYAFSFDGFDDAVTVSDASSLDAMANFSFDAWVSFRTNPAGRVQFVMAKGPASGPSTSSYALWLNGDGTISAAVETAAQLATVSSTSRIAAARRYHVAVTYDGENVRLYINGSVAGTAALTGAVRGTVDPLHLGRRGGAGVDGGGDSIDGTVDEARIWRRALTAAEVRAAYDAGCDLNAPPVADAGEDQIVECSGHGTVVTLDGRSSSDPDGDTLNYEWFEGTTLIATGPFTEATLPAGSHTVRLQVTDPGGLTSEETVNVTIIDTTAPVVVAPADVTASCPGFISDDVLGIATASDLCSRVEVERRGVPAGNLFPAGTTTITYTARDAAGNESSVQQFVTVADRTAPAMANVHVTPAKLWPPNHKMVDVFVGHEATDACGGATVSLSVESSDPVSGNGDTTGPDWLISDSHRIQLRAERAPKALERIYTITITARDGAGNESQQRVTVRVAP